MNPPALMHGVQDDKETTSSARSESALGTCIGGHSCPRSSHHSIQVLLTSADTKRCTTSVELVRASAHPVFTTSSAGNGQRRCYWFVHQQCINRVHGCIPYACKHCTSKLLNGQVRIQRHAATERSNVLQSLTADAPSPTSPPSAAHPAIPSMLQHSHGAQCRCLPQCRCFVTRGDCSLLAPQHSNCIFAHTVPATLSRHAMLSSTARKRLTQ